MFDEQSCRRSSFATSVLTPDHDAKASLRRASALLEKGGLKEAARLLALAADAIVEGRRRH